jgi:hypothetical membrane protein
MLSVATMKRNNLLLFGPIAAVILGVGIVVLGHAVPGYSHIHQTVSEIGEVGSPARAPFTALLCVVAISLFVFAMGVGQVSRSAGCPPWAAYFIAFMAIPAAGVGIFAFPHPLHNVFGMSELIGYQAPLAFALSWRRKPDAKQFVAFSWVMFFLVWLAIALNLSSIAPHSAIWEYLKPRYGLVQRSLFAAWFCWCGVLGIMLWRWRPVSRVQT